MICKTCGEDKSESEYYTESRNRSGLNSSCKGCVRARNKTYAYTPRKPETPEQRARHLASGKVWLDKNREVRREYERVRNQRPEVKVKRNRRLVESGRGVEFVNARRVRLVMAEGSHTIEEWEAVCVQARHRCLACGQERPLTRDHIIPLSRGGTDWISNIQPLCGSCNARKGQQVMDFRYATPI